MESIEIDIENIGNSLYIIDTVALCDREKLDGYPTIRHYAAGKYREPELFGRTEDTLRADIQRILDGMKSSASSSEKKTASAETTFEQLQPKERGDDLDAPVVLSPHTFDGVIKSDDRKTVWVVEFYSPTCMHCVQFRPKYQAVAKRVNWVGSRVKLANVDCAENRGAYSFTCLWKRHF